MDTLFDLPAAVPRPIRTLIPPAPRVTPAVRQTPLWTSRPPAPVSSHVAPGPSRAVPLLPPMPEDITGSVAALLGFTHDSEGASAGQFRLCLWTAVEAALETAGWPRHTWDFIHERDRRIAAIQHCSDCPGANTCRSWQLRRATIAVRQELLRQGRDPEQAWPLRWGVIREQFRRFRRPLPLFVHPDTSDIETALQAGATLTVNGLTFVPWPAAPVFLVTGG
ncbi:MAG TPA: hypothetical protein PKH77_25960 [Anaerolineae bacterium]|nr:hypothetical protein [Anaerolineae bacterium]